ncbi:MAG: hypothetical protein AB8B85_23095 [Paracoccaceae bacterium]
MSAFVVSRTVIHIATDALIAHERRPVCADTLGRGLWAMNVEAVSQRYRLASSREGQRSRDDYMADVSGDRFERITGLDPATICKQVECQLYQCLEGNVPERDPLFPRLEEVAQALAAPFGGDAHHDHPAWRSAPWGMQNA